MKCISKFTRLALAVLLLSPLAALHAADQTHCAEHGRPPKKKPAEGIHDMAARLRLLRHEKQNLLNAIEDNFSQYDNDAEHRAYMQAALVKVNEGLREAEERLREYQLQHDGLN